MERFKSVKGVKVIYKEDMKDLNKCDVAAIKYIQKLGSRDMELVIPCNQEIVNIDGRYILRDKKPQYPKTYEECCEVLGISRYDVDIDLPQPYQEKMFNLFKLRICYDAYCKIAGEQMGMDKSWEPDWDNLSTNHEFIKINKGCFTYSSRVLVFPTKEMRDEFYKNFKDLIERCKEFL